MRRARIALRLALMAPALMALTLSPASARAQRGVDGGLFHPALDSFGIFSVDRADISRPWEFGFKLSVNYAADPLRATMSDPTDPTHARSADRVLIDRQTVMNLGFHLGLARWLEIVGDFPISSQSYTAAYGSYGSAADPMLGRSGFYLANRFTNLAPPNAAPLDARLGFKARLLRHGMFGLGASVVATLPFGDDSAFLGDTSFTFRPTLIADLTRGAFTVALDVGAIVRQETRVYDPYDVAARQANPRLLFDVGDELTWAIGAAYRFVRWVGVGVEADGLVPLVGQQKDFTVDLLGGLRIFPTPDLVIEVGAGAGVLTHAERHETFRGFVVLSWTPVVGGRDASTLGGLDSDNDGISDAQDLCPNEPEDRDGFDDEDGCPDLDNDQDGIPDRLDRCPNEPEDRDGFQDEDGCPDVDNDGDGIPDVQDRCPNEAEDRDGFEDEDGCPDEDNDGDGIPDALDKCPNEPETRNGVDDEDGCPDSGGQVVVSAGRIQLPDPIMFESGRVGIAARSEALLNRVADRIKANPQVRRIRIEGHTDDVGTTRKNQELSQARAEAVRDYLIRKGVDADRLQAVGFGNSRPIDNRKSVDARVKNRRVELIIVEQ